MWTTEPCSVFQVVPWVLSIDTHNNNNNNNSTKPRGLLKCLYGSVTPYMSSAHLQTYCAILLLLLLPRSIRRRLRFCGWNLLYGGDSRQGQRSSPELMCQQAKFLLSGSGGLDNAWEDAPSPCLQGHSHTQRSLQCVTWCTYGAWVDSVMSSDVQWWPGLPWRVGNSCLWVVIRMVLQLLLPLLLSQLFVIGDLMIFLWQLPSFFRQSVCFIISTYVIMGYDPLDHGLLGVLL